jgi:predicted ATPase
MTEITNEDVERVPLLKIGFIGTGGTGKTSVAEKLKELIPEDFRPSIVRSVMGHLGVTDAMQASMSAAQCWSVQKALADAKFNQDDEFDTGLFDRTPIDHLAYALYRCADQISDQVYGALVERVQEYVDQYDVVFYFPIYEWEVVDDGFRQQGLAYRATHDMLLRQLLTEMEIDAIEMPDASVDERVELILSVLQDERDTITSIENDDDEPSDDDSAEARV